MIPNPYYPGILLSPEDVVMTRVIEYEVSEGMRTAELPMQKHQRKLEFDDITAEGMSIVNASTTIKLADLALIAAGINLRASEGYIGDLDHILRAMEHDPEFEFMYYVVRSWTLKHNDAASGYIQFRDNAVSALRKSKIAHAI